VDEGEQPAEEDIQVELVAQPYAARLDASGSVVPAPVEAPIHHTLDASSATAQPHGSAQADNTCQGPGRRRLDSTE